jgi:hypothetical protein
MALVLDGTLGITTNSGTAISASTIGVGGATPSTSGAGITFPATQSASTDANTLDDYEEGTWTPSLGGTTTYSERFGSYTKIGRQVTAIFDFTISSIGTGNQAQISGLPFTATSSGPTGMNASVSYWANLSIAVNWLAWRVDINATVLQNAITTSATATAIANSNILTNGTRIIGTLVYNTN